MAATTTWYEQNGTATGTPAHGTESAVSSCDWKNVDDASTPRAQAPVLAGSNSFGKYLYVRFSGVFNQISNVKFAHTAGTLGTGISLMGKISSDYTQPSTTALTGATDITNTTAIGSGASVLLGTDPNDTNPSASATSACATQYIITQVQTQASAAAGDSGQATLTVQYNEN